MATGRLHPHAGGWHPRGPHGAHTPVFTAHGARHCRRDGRTGPIELPLNPGFEYGLLPLEGAVTLADEGETFAADELDYLGTGRSHLRLTLAPGTRALLLGGAPFGEDIVMWWNFVDEARAPIAESRQQWEDHDPRFGTVVEGEHRRVPAPALPWAAGHSTG